MNKKRIGITTDCTCDLPKPFLTEHEIDLIYFYIKTSMGEFMDGYEITASNIFEMFARGEKPESIVPNPEEIAHFFRKKLRQYDEVIHITISSGVSPSYDNCTRALELLDERQRKKIFLVDSLSLSSGTGLVVSKAVALRKTGMNTTHIIDELQQIIPCICASFIVPDMSYLAANGLVTHEISTLFNLLHLHPVLILQNGKIKVKRFFFGNYEIAREQYIRYILAKQHPDLAQVFLTHVACPVSSLAHFQEIIHENAAFQQLTIAQASASVSNNCGPNTMGVLFLNKQE